MTLNGGPASLGRVPMTIFERSRPGRRAWSLPHGEVDGTDLPERFLRRTPPRLPEVNEPTLVCHYTQASERNFAIDNAFYPLGSCTMKYNPKVTDRAASLFADLHPRQSYRTTQGVLALAYDLEQILARLTGMDFVSLQPQAGAQSAFTALLVFKAYHAKRGEAGQRRRIIVPDSAHGTNPASAAMCGYEVTTVKSDARQLDSAESPITRKWPTSRLYLAQRGQPLEVSIQTLSSVDVLAAVVRRQPAGHTQAQVEGPQAGPAEHMPAELAAARRTTEAVAVDTPPAVARRDTTPSGASFTQRLNKLMSFFWISPLAFASSNARSEISGLTTVPCLR